MDQTRLAPAGSFCWNPDSPEYAQVGHYNLRKFGQTARGVQRYQCKTCKKTYAETKGTVFHGCHHSQQTILDCLAMLADRTSGDWHYLQVVKERSGSRLIAVLQVVYGDPHEVSALLGKHTAYVERTHLTSRQMNGRLIRKSLSYSKQLKLLRVACSWEDWVYNLTRPLKMLLREQAVGYGQPRWQARTPAMAAGLTDHMCQCALSMCLSMIVYACERT